MAPSRRPPKRADWRHSVELLLAIFHSCPRDGARRQRHGEQEPGGEDAGPATRKRPVPRWVRRQSMEVAGMQMGGGGRRGRKAWAHAQRGGERGEKEENTKKQGKKDIMIISSFYVFF